MLLLAHDKELPVSISNTYMNVLTRTGTLYSDIDILCHWLNPGRPMRVSSFGSLQHFRKEMKPKEAGAATRCLECPYERDCAYSAKKSVSYHFWDPCGSSLCSRDQSTLTQYQRAIPAGLQQPLWMVSQISRTLRRPCEWGRMASASMKVTTTSVTTR